MSGSIRINGGTPGVPNLGILAFSTVTLSDVGGGSPQSRLWVIDKWPDNQVSAPSLTGATSSSATFQGGDGVYEISLTRVEANNTTTLARITLAVVDSDGVSLPSPDMDPDLLAPLGSTAKRAGWGGSRAAGTNSFLLAYLRNLKGKAQESQGFDLLAKGASTGNVALTGALTHDGVTYSTGQIFFAKDQTLPVQNGPWVVNTDGTWTRHPSVDTVTPPRPGMKVYVESGTANKGVTYLLVTTGAITVGVTGLTFIRTKTEIDARVLCTADGVANDATNLQNSFQVSPEVVYSSGTYLVDASVSIGSIGKTHRFDRGGQIKVAAGRTVTIRGHIEAAPDQQIFDVSSGGTVVTPDMNEVWVAWRGGLGDSDANDDAPAIAASSVFPAAGGGKLRFHNPSNGYFSLRSQIRIGTAGAQTQGVEWVFDRANISEASAGPYADLKVLAELGSGNAAILVRGTIRCNLGSPDIDCNGLSDIGIEIAAPLTSTPLPSEAGITSWQNRFSGVIRNARLAEIVSGEAILESTVSGSTFTVAYSGHPLRVDQRIYLRAPRITGYAVPSGFDPNTVYRVVSKTSSTYVLCEDDDDTNTPVVASNGGSGRWVVGVCDDGDCSQLFLDHVHFGKSTVAGVRPIWGYYQHGDNTYCTTLDGCWGQGTMNGQGTAFTADTEADTITTALQLIDGNTFRHIEDGDMLLVWPDSVFGGGVLPDLLSDTVYHVRDKSGSGATRTCKLAAAPGGSALDLSGGVGTFTCDALGSPMFHVGVIAGSVRMNACASVAAYERIDVGFRPGSIKGPSIHDLDADSQDWRRISALQDGITCFPQNGGIELSGTHAPPWPNAPLDAVRYDLPPGSYLDVRGVLGGNIKVGGTSKIDVSATLESGGTWLPLVVGPDGTETTLPAQANYNYSSNGTTGFTKIVGQTITWSDGTANRLQLKDDGGGSPQVKSLNGSGLSLFGNTGWIHLIASQEVKVQGTRLVLTSTDGVIASISQALSGVGVLHALLGQDAAAASSAHGGDIAIRGGAGDGAGLSGGILLDFDAGADHAIDLRQVNDVNGTRRVISLCKIAASTVASDVPSGDGTILVATCQSAPISTRPPVGGVQLYATGNGGWYAMSYDGSIGDGPGIQHTIVPRSSVPSGKGTPSFDDLVVNIVTTNEVQTGFLDSISVPSSGQVVSYNARIKGHTSDGDSIVLDLDATAKNVSGTVSIVGTPPAVQVIGVDAALVSATASFALISNAIYLTVTGVAATTITWSAKIKQELLA